MNFLTVIALLRLGHIVCNAVRHVWKSDCVGRSCGQRRDDCCSALLRHVHASKSILFPEAVNISNMKRTCCDTCTRLSRFSVSPKYPLLIRAFMMYWLFSLGNCWSVSAMTTFTPNALSFSHNIFIQGCVTRCP